MTTTTTKGKAAVARALLAAVAAGLLAYFLLRGGGAAPEGAPADPYDEPYARLKDPAYLEQVRVQTEEFREIMRRIDATRREIAALGENPDTNSPRYVELRRQLESQAAEIEKNRIKSQMIVRDRIAQENEAIKAKQENLKQKGK